MRDGYVPVDGADLYFKQVGEGDPLVAIHGGPGGGANHRHLSPHLDGYADRYQVTYYDQRGKGRSRGDLDPDQVSVETYVDDLHAVCDYLELDRPNLLGHSWGGLLTMSYAIRHPGRPRRLILMHTAAASKREHDEFSKYQDSLVDTIRDEAEEITSSEEFKAGDPATTERFARMFYGLGFADPEDADQLDVHVPDAESVLRSRLISMRFTETLFSQEYDLIPDLAELDTPTLVIHGDHDWIPLPAVERIATAMPNASLVVLADCGHFAQIEQPEALRETIDSFFSTT